MYIGDKHQDAEIVIDLEEEKIDMDFSSLSNYYNSNNMEYDYKLKTNKFFFILNRIFLPVPLVFTRDILFQLNKIILKLFQKTYKKHNGQYIYQKAIKYLAYNLDGIITETIEGELPSTNLTVRVRANLYVEYHLFEDYQDLIKKISLKRHIVQIENSVEKRTQQNGWDFVFEFKEPPKKGYVTISSIY